MATIRPFRDYDEHEVINLFAMSGLATKGTFVTAVGSGFNFETASSFDDNSYIAGSISARFNVPHLLAPAGSGVAATSVLGMTLKTVQAVDENGYPLKFEPKKAAERDLIISGEAVPVVKRGLFLYSGVVGTPAFGSGLALSDAGDGSLKTVSPAASGYDAAKVVAQALGPKDSNGFVLIDIKL